jgi:hypothetical protein
MAAFPDFMDLDPSVCAVAFSTLANVSLSDMLSVEDTATTCLDWVLMPLET